MDELALLWLFMSGSLFLGAVIVVLALGALFGVGWLLWKACVFTAETIDCLIEGRPPAEKVIRDDTVIVHTRVPRAGVCGTGEQRDVRVPQRLVPASPVAARRDLADVQRRGRRAPRGRHG